MTKLNLSIQYADKSHAPHNSPDWQTVLPRPLLRRWVKAALLPATSSAQLTLRFVDEAEARALNREFRGKDYATNVLTFAYNDGNDADEFADLPAEIRAQLVATGEISDTDEMDDMPLSADIVLCGAVLQREADEQRKTLVEHAAHLVVHGVLHAQGYDHMDDDEAAEMEALETQILAKLGFANPYEPQA